MVRPGGAKGRGHPPRRALALTGARASRHAVIFDFDFTLVDSSAGFLASHRYAAEKHGLVQATEDVILHTIGIGLPEVPLLLYGEAGTAVATEYIRDYQARADEVMAGLTRLLPSAHHAVAALIEDGLSLAIVSQKLRRRILEILAREGLEDYFTAVIGGDQVANFKPDPEGLLAALSLMKAESAIFVGDTTIDAETAQRANLPFAAVLSGVTPREDFEVFAPAAILPDVGGLPEFCRAWHW